MSRVLNKCSTFVWICLYSLLHEVKAKEFACSDPEHAFFLVEHHIVFSGLLENSFEMSGMTNLLFGFYNHVVHVYFENVTDFIFFVHFVHQSVICYTCIFKSVIQTELNCTINIPNFYIHGLIKFNVILV